MTDKQIIKKLAERYKEICENPFADGYTFKAFEGRCAEQGFTIDDVRNYIEKEKQEQKAKQSESIESLKEQLKAKEQECERLKKELQAQRAFTAHEQKLIYCVAYDESCKTGNDCKQKKCVFKDNIKLKQTLAEIKEIAEEQVPYLNIGEAKTMIEVEYDYAGAICNLEQRMYKILQKISEYQVENDRCRSN